MTSNIRIENDDLILSLELKNEGLVWSQDILPIFIQALNGMGYVVPDIEEWSYENDTE